MILNAEPPKEQNTGSIVQPGTRLVFRHHYWFGCVAVRRFPMAVDGSFAKCRLKTTTALRFFQLQLSGSVLYLAVCVSFAACGARPRSCFVAEGLARDAGGGADGRASGADEVELEPAQAVQSRAKRAYCTVWAEPARLPAVSQSACVRPEQPRASSRRRTLHAPSSQQRARRVASRNGGALLDAEGNPLRCGAYLFVQLL